MSARIYYLVKLWLGLFTVVFCYSSIVNAQTGPAGVGSSANNSVWLDAHALAQTNGSLVSSWTDISGNNHHFGQVTSSRQPTYFTAVFNGMPAVDFDGVNDYLSSGANTQLSNISHIEIFCVTKSDDVTQNETIFSTEYSGTTIDKLMYGQYTTTNSYNSFGRLSGVSPTIVKSSFGAPASHNILHTEFNIGTNALNSYLNGTLISTANSTRDPGTNVNSTLGTSFLLNYYYDGQVSEFIIFVSDLNSLERILVENYLGAKYGTSLPTDLYAYQATHNIGLIGIGNNGTNSQTSANGAGILQISSPASMTSNEYLLTAHTDDNLDLFTTADIPVSLVGSQRWTRTWIVDETGDVGSLTIDFTLLGADDFASSSSYRLLVDNITQDGDFSDATIVAGTYDGGTQTVSFSVDLNDGDLFTLCGIEEILEIHSITSGAWSDVNTWDCTCIPTQNDLVHIDPLTNVTVDINAVTDYLAIELNGTLSMSSPVTLSIYGDWDILGSVNLTGGVIQLVGEAGQNINASGNSVSLNDLEINNNSGNAITFFQGEYILNGTLYPTLGNLVIDSNPGNSFIVNSTSDVGGGRIAAFGTGASLNGDVTVRRFIPAGVADFRDIASPVIGATLSDWDDDLLISGTGFPDGCAIGSDGACFYSVKRYISNQYVDQTSMSNPLTNGVGFEAYMGDDTIIFSGTTLDVTGPIHTGSDYLVNVGSGWQIQGNPFASPIAFSSINRSHVDNYFYVYDASTGFYEYWDGSDNSSSIPELAGGVIATGQGFWTYDWGTLTYDEADKVSSATYVKSAISTEVFQIRLRENNSTYNSSISLSENVLSTDDLDTILDIRHFSTGTEKAPTIAFYASENEDLIRKNYIKDDRRNKSFDLYTKILNPGYYTFEAINIENFNNYNKVLLFDHATNEFIDLKKELAYTFYSDIFEGQRFTLILTNEEISEGATVQSLTINETGVAEESLTITQMGHTFNVVVNETSTNDSQVRLVNVLGQTEVYSTNIHLVEGSNIIAVPAELKGVHILIITNGDKMVTKKVVL